jgi:hypothetical protein
LLAQFAHMIAVLYVIKFGSGQFKLVVVVVDNFVISQATRTHCANGAGFYTDPG